MDTNRSGRGATGAGSDSWKKADLRRCFQRPLAVPAA